MRGQLFFCVQSFISRLAINLLIVFELFGLIITANMTLGEYNSRTMLYEPIRPYIERQGFFINDMSEDNVLHENEIKQIADLDILKLTFYSTIGVNITVLPDNVFDKLLLPISKGERFKSDEVGSKAKVIVTHNNSNIAVGDIVGGINDSGFEVTAMLTDPTYLMSFAYNIDMSYEDMYLKYESEYYDGQAYFYTSMSQFEKANADKKNIQIHKMCLAVFKSPVSEEEYNAIKNELISKDYLLIDNDIIREKSEKILSDDFKRLFPPVFVFGVIVLIGIVSCSVIGVKTIMKELGVFYCCGATKFDCVVLAVEKMTFTILISGIAAAVSMVIIGTRILSELVGFVYSENNIILTIGIIFGTVIISAIAPVVMISRTHPRELLTDTANE